MATDRLESRRFAWRVTEATASHEKGEVVIKCSKPVSDDKLRDAVEKAGYKFIG